MNNEGLCKSRAKESLLSICRDAANRAQSDGLFYGEDEVVQMVQDQNLGMLFYVAHNTKEMFDEYTDYCADNQLPVDEESSALAFLNYRDKQMEEDMM